MIPLGEKIIEKKTCRLSGQEFFITDKDLEFYDKISPVFGGKKFSIPSPTLCSEERMRRRLCFRNERRLYKRKCNKTGKEIISVYAPDKPYTIYEQKVWWSDNWSPFEYGKNFDFEKGFFEQFHEFLQRVPRISLNNKNAENSEYCHPAIDSKNSYLCSSSSTIENCLFSNQIDNCRDCIDTLIVGNNELCYECVNVFFSYGLTFCQNCNNCQSSHYLIDCENCSECAFCIGLSKKKNHILNRSFSQEKYREILLTLQSDELKRQEMFSEFQKLKTQSFYKAEIMQKCEHCLGNYLYTSVNCFNSFEVTSSDNVRYSSVIRRNGKDVYDTDALIDSELCLEQISTIESYGSAMNAYLWYCKEAFFCDTCTHSNNIFACISLKKSHHCILNTPYSIQEYETLCGKIIDHMRSTGEWGEFFPHELSPFGYNETVAMEYFPMTKEEVLEKGWNWYEEEAKNYDGIQNIVPKNIQEYDEKTVGFEVAQKNITELLSGMIKCEVTGKPFKIIKQELVFYIENHLPIPTKHPDQRHKERMNLRNPRKLWERYCMCESCEKIAHETGTWKKEEFVQLPPDKGGEQGEGTLGGLRRRIVTTYAPERKERVVCEECYQKLVY